MSERSKWIDNLEHATGSDQVRALINILWDRELEYLIALSPHSGEGEKHVAALQVYLEKLQRRDDNADMAPVPVSPIAPSLYSLREGLERLLIDSLDVSAFLDEPSYADFEAATDARFRRIRNEAGLAVQACAWFLRGEGEQEGGRVPVDVLRRKLERLGDDFDVEKIDIVRAAVVQAEALAKALYELSDSATFRNELNRKNYEAWRTIHSKVGTFARRMWRPMLNFVWTGMVTLAGYMLVGSVVPASFVLTILFVLPVIAAVEADTAQWKRLNDRVGRIRQKLSRLAPPNAELGDSGALWKARTSKQVEAAINATLDAISDGRMTNVRQEAVAQWDARLAQISRWSSRLADSWLEYFATAANMVLLALIVMLLSYSRNWPNNLVIGEIGLTRCVLAEGRILWPGPIEVVVSGRSGLAIISASRVAMFLPGGHGRELPRCVEPESGQIRLAGSETELEAAIDSLFALTVAIPQKETEVVRRFGDKLLLPVFSRPVRKCAPEEVERAGAVDQAMRESLVRLGAAFARCGARIDVRGYASSRAFRCGDEVTSRNLNWRLAESRRRSVIELLASGQARSRNKARTDELVVAPPNNSPRFDNPQEMEDARDSEYNDRTNGQPDGVKEALTRSVVIELIHKGICAGREASAGHPEGAPKSPLHQPLNPRR